MVSADEDMLIHVVNGSRTFIQQFCQNSWLKSLTKKQKQKEGGGKRGRDQEETGAKISKNKQTEAEIRKTPTVYAVSLCVSLCVSLSFSLSPHFEIRADRWKKLSLERNLDVGEIHDNPSTVNTARQVQAGK